MSSTAGVTMIKIVESLPEATQNQVVEHLQEYLADLQGEIGWYSFSQKTQSQFMVAAHHNRQEKVI